MPEIGISESEKVKVLAAVRATAESQRPPLPPAAIDAIVQKARDELSGN